MMLVPQIEKDRRTLPLVQRGGTPLVARSRASTAFPRSFQLGSRLCADYTISVEEVDGREPNDSPA